MFNKNANDEEKPQKVSLLKKRSFRYGSLATVFTILFVAIIIGVNVGVSWMSNRFPISIDLTSNKSYKLSSKSIKYIKSIKNKITIDMLAEQSDYLSNTEYAPVAKVINELPQYNSNITVKYVDLAKNPTFSTNYSSASLEQYGVLVVAGSRYKALAMTDIVQTQTDSTTYETTVTGYDTENQIDSALIYVTTSNLPVVDITTGHGEQDTTGLQSLLKKNNYTIGTVNIASSGISSNAQALVIADPSADFTSTEIKKIDDFLNNGGKAGKNLFVFLDPQEAKLPNLENYLAEWGISAGSGVIYDTQNSIGGSQFYVLNGDTNSDVVGTLPTNEYSVLAIARPLNLLFSTQGDYTTTSAVSTQDTSKLFNPAGGVANAKTFTASSSDKSGPFTVAAKSTKQMVYNNNGVNSNVLVFGSYSLIDSSLLQESNLTNSDLVINSFNKVGGFKSPITVNAKTVDSTTLNITATQQRIIEVLFIVIIPLAVLAAGLIVWLRRRHL